MPANELVKDWLAALRSGDYQQTKATLKSNEGYCCLGVLTDLCAKRGDERVVVTRDNLGWLDRPKDGSNTFPNWSTISTQIFYEITEFPLFGNITQSVLMNMNDTDGRSFEEIATYIETEIARYDEHNHEAI